MCLWRYYSVPIHFRIAIIVTVRLIQRRLKVTQRSNINFIGIQNFRLWDLNCINIDFAIYREQKMTQHRLEDHVNILEWLQLREYMEC